MQFFRRGFARADGFQVFAVDDAAVPFLDEQAAVDAGQLPFLGEVAVAFDFKDADVRFLREHL